MSRHDDAVRLRHMREHAREAVTLVRGKKRQDLDSERVLSLALVRLLEISVRRPAALPRSCRHRILASPGHRSWACEIV
jgi:hypothetical protein